MERQEKWQSGGRGGGRRNYTSKQSLNLPERYNDSWTYTSECYYMSENKSHKSIENGNRMDLFLYN